MNALTILELECLALFIAHRSELWTRYAQELGTDPESVPRALAAEHSRRVAKRCKEKTTL